MNQIFLTGRICNCEMTADGKLVMIEIYQYEPDEVERIPVYIDETSKVFIRDFRNGNLVSIIGRLKFEESIKIIVEKINFAG